MAFRDVKFRVTIGNIKSLFDFLFGRKTKKRRK